MSSLLRDASSAVVLPELLVPAGGREQLEAALLYGADAVFLGGHSLNLRAASDGFDQPALKQAVQDAHAAGTQVYYCLNALPYDSALPELEQTLEYLPDCGIDALIVADPGVIRLARRYCPNIPLHLSTQAHSVNAQAVAFWQEAGISRINLARELSASAIRTLCRTCPEIEFEAFVHGAMCLALSGHCLLSAWMNGRSANLGQCTQPCRFEYKGLFLGVAEKKRTLSEAQPFPDLEITQDEDFSAFWAPQDLCLLRYVGWFVRSGVSALKVEGRSKSGSYVAQVTDVYRTALLRVASRMGSLVEDAGVSAAVSELSITTLLQELSHTASRPFCTGFFLPRRRVEKVVFEGEKRPIVARLIEPLSSGGWRVRVLSPWSAARDVSVLLPGMRRPVSSGGTYVLENHRRERVSLLHPGTEGFWHGAPAEAYAGLYVRA